MNHDRQAKTRVLTHASIILPITWVVLMDLGYAQALPKTHWLSDSLGLSLEALLSSIATVFTLACSIGMLISRARRLQSVTDACLERFGANPEAAQSISRAHAKETSRLEIVSVCIGVLHLGCSWHGSGRCWKLT